MHHVNQIHAENATDARQRKDVAYFARAALASFVALKLVCSVSGCASQEQRDATLTRHHSAAPIAPEGPPQVVAAPDGAEHSAKPVRTAKPQPPPAQPKPQRQAKAVEDNRSDGDEEAGSLFVMLSRWLEPMSTYQAESTSRHEPAADVWARLRRGFRLSDSPDFRIARSVTTNFNNQALWSRVEDRGRHFLPLVVEQVEDRDLPLELALLPIVESTYNPGAVSPSRAAGLWQIIPSTAQHLGMDRGKGYDARHDVVASTDAALAYLETLASEFDGDWELALAAYNAGSGTVQKAIRRNREKGKPTDYWSLDLPGETEQYVPKLLAAARVVKKPEAYGVRLGYIPAEPAVAPIVVEQEVDLSLTARLANMSLGELRELNPGFLQPRASVTEGQVVLVPREKALEAAQNLKKSAEVTAVSNQEMKEKPKIADALPATTKTHVVAKGDTLWTLAREHRVAVAALAKANRLKLDSRLREGQQLVIPASLPRTSQVLPSESRNRI
jgi:membrane-bound lytic murein transglycosylase D